MNNKTLKCKPLLFLLFILIFINLNACSMFPVTTLTKLTTRTITNTETKLIPGYIIEKADQFIISKVGEEYFYKYIFLNTTGTKYCEVNPHCIEHPESCSKYLQNPYYLMVYSLKNSDKPYVDGLIEFAVDIEGNLIIEREPYGIPDILNDPKKGEFPVDQKKAIEIAKQNGLEAGLGDWEVHFGWYAKNLNIYVWSVNNTLVYEYTYMSGKNMIINANNGNIIEVKEWDAFLNRERPK